MKKKDKTKKNKVFGVSIQYDTSELPSISLELIKHLEEKEAKNVVGIFRLSGDNNTIMSYKDKIDSGKKYNLNDIQDINVVTGLLKLYFRELPEPLCTYESYDMFIAANGVPDDEARMIMIKKVLSFLPPTNFKLLRTLCKFLHGVCLNRDNNKMSSNNLAICFAPNLLALKMSDIKKNDMNAIMFQQQQSTQLMTSFIENYYEIFEQDEEKSMMTNNNTNTNKNTNTNNTSTPLNNQSNNQIHSTQRNSSQPIVQTQQPKQLPLPPQKKEQNLNISDDEEKKRVNSMIHRSQYVNKTRRRKLPQIPGQENEEGEEYEEYEDVPSLDTPVSPKISEEDKIISPRHITKKPGSKAPVKKASILKRSNPKELPKVPSIRTRKPAVLNEPVPINTLKEVVIEPKVEENNEEKIRKEVKQENQTTIKEKQDEFKSIEKTPSEEMEVNNEPTIEQKLVEPIPKTQKVEEEEEEEEEEKVEEKEVNIIQPTLEELTIEPKLQVDQPIHEEEINNESIQIEEKVENKSKNIELTNNNNPDETNNEMKEIKEEENGEEYYDESQIYVSLYDYDASTEHELTIRVGEEFLISEEIDGWSSAINLANNNSGWVPSNYIQLK
eukprot:gene10182-2602_t